jgi:hypothetical protein
LIDSIELDDPLTLRSTRFGIGIIDTLTLGAFDELQRHHRNPRLH